MEEQWNQGILCLFLLSAWNMHNAVTIASIFYHIGVPADDERLIAIFIF